MYSFFPFPPDTIMTQTEKKQEFELKKKLLLSHLVGTADDGEGSVSGSDQADAVELEGDEGTTNVFSV